MTYAITLTTILAICFVTVIIPAVVTQRRIATELDQGKERIKSLRDEIANLKKELHDCYRELENT
jgi:uncharacterized protein YoxC